MLEIDPKKRISAADALKHNYLEPVMIDNEFELIYEEIDDHSDLTNRINKINEEYFIYILIYLRTYKFDMLRIN